MREDRQSSEGFMLVARRSFGRPQAGAAVVVAVLTVLASVAVCVAAVLAPAPPIAVPFVVAICVGCPVFACWELPPALACLRADRAHRAAGQALSKLRQGLEQLPEVEHPLGF